MYMNNKSMTRATCMCNVEMTNFLKFKLLTCEKRNKNILIFILYSKNMHL